MPLYEYRCESCSSLKETFQKMDVVQIPCQCGGNMKRQISLGSFVLNGNGWYKTDFKDKK